MRALNYAAEPIPPSRSAVERGRNTAGGRYPLPWKNAASRVRMSKSYLHMANPRIIFISSRVPAADVNKHAPIIDC